MRENRDLDLRREIASVRHLADWLRHGPYASSVGCYPLVLWTVDGDAVSFAGLRAEFASEARKVRDREPGRIAWCDVYWEGPAETCCLTNEPIESAYGDPDASACSCKGEP